MEATSTLDRHQRPSERIVELVAELEDVESAEVTPPLYEAVDPDALDDLFDGGYATCTSADLVSFTYREYDVTVSTEGDETVVELSDARTREASSSEA